MAAGELSAASRTSPSNRGGMEETRAHGAIGLEHRRYPRRVAAHRREVRRVRRRAGVVADGCARATRVPPATKPSCEQLRRRAATACSIASSKAGRSSAGDGHFAGRSAVHGSGRLNAVDERSAARNEISSNPMRCAAAMVSASARVVGALHHRAGNQTRRRCCLPQRQSRRGDRVEAAFDTAGWRRGSRGRRRATSRRYRRRRGDVGAHGCRSAGRS